MAIQSFFPERLRLGRQLLGLSLDAVGDKVGASRQFLHQLETGAKEPTDDMKAALAAALQVDPSFFSLRLTNQVQTEHCHFRKLKTVPQWLALQASARASGVSLIIDSLEQKVGFPDVDIPSFTQPTHEPLAIEAAAELARSHWNLGLDAPISNMVRVLERAGVIVVRFDDLSERIDALSVSRRRPLVVRSTVKGDGARPRFDLAHELGHLVMHQGIVTGDAETEGQAHRFASAFLVPARAFVREFPRPYGRRLDWQGIVRMKVRWGMSMRAIIRRAYDLRLIDAAQYRTGNIHLMKSGQSKVEDGDSQIQSERPELLVAALNYLERTDARAIHLLIKELAMSACLFQKLTGYSVEDLPDNITLFPDFRS